MMSNFVQAMPLTCLPSAHPPMSITPADTLDLALSGLPIHHTGCSRALKAAPVFQEIFQYCQPSFRTGNGFLAHTEY